MHFGVAIVSLPRSVRPACFAALAGIALLLGGCRNDAPPDVVLVSLDTVRADVFDEVAAREPALAALRERAVVFRAAMTPTPLTLPAHASLLGGVDPNRHGTRNNGQVVMLPVPSLAERLRDAGYATGAVVSAFPLDRRFGLDRGFDRYEQPSASSAPRSEFATLERAAPDSVAAALRWFDAQTAPRFLWLHLFDAHAPYVAPGSDPQAPLRARYADEIAYIGKALAPLLERLEDSGRPFVLVLVADHGEGLGDHGELDHGLLLHDSTVLVPMLWYAPQRWQPRHIDQVARLVDVVPTVLATLGLDPQPLSDGIDLGPLLAGGELTIPPGYAETFYPQFAYRHAPLRSLREVLWKLIATDDVAELYAIGDDPHEQHDRSADEPARVDAMRFDLAQRPEPSARAAAAPEAIRQLQSLGYLAAGATQEAASGHPRDVVDAHRRLVELQSLVGDGAGDVAIAAARSLLAEQPDNAFAAYVLGTLLLDRGDAVAAVPVFEAALQHDPQNPQTHFKLGETLMRLQRHADALVHWQVLETLDPTRAAVWTNEAGALAALGNWDDAWIAIVQARMLAPDDAVVLDNVATIAEALGRWADAADALQVLAAQPATRPDDVRLGLVLLRADRAPDADRAFARVSPQARGFAVARLGRAVAAVRAGRADEARAALASFTSERDAALLQRFRSEFSELDTVLPR